MNKKIGIVAGILLALSAVSNIILIAKTGSIHFWQIISIAGSACLAVGLIGFRKLQPVGSGLLLLGVLPSMSILFDQSSASMAGSLGILLRKIPLIVFLATVLIISLGDTFVPGLKKTRKKIQYLPLIMAVLSVLLGFISHFVLYHFDVAIVSNGISGNILPCVTEILIAIYLIEKKEKPVYISALAAPVNRPMTDGEVIARLQAYKRLLDNGIITEAEFEEKKAKVMNQFR